MHTILPRLRPCLGVWFLFLTLLVLTASSTQRVAASVAAGQMTYHVDPTFSLSTETPGGRVCVVAATSDGGTLIGGEFSNIAGQPRRCLAKLKADGTLDSSFNARAGFSGITDVSGYGARVLSLAVQTDGRIVVGGFFTSYNGMARKNILRLNADGSLDTSFQPGSGFTGSTSIGSNGVFDASAVSAIALQSDGRVLVGGTFKSFNGTARNYIARLNTDGSLDTSFNPGTGLNGWNIGGAIVVQSDGRSVVAGYFSSYNGVARKNIVRLNTDGSLDTTFDPGVSFSSIVQGLALQPDGRILAVGQFGTYRGVDRLGIARLNTDASLDTTFAPAGGGYIVDAVALQSDGRILIGGDFNYFSTVARNNIARLNADGSVDLTFNPGTGFGTDNTQVNSVGSIALHADGRISAGGLFATFNGNPARCFARLTATGARDIAFPNPLLIPVKVKSILPLADGKWIVGGSFTVVNGVAQGGIARINADGSLDDSFNTGTGFEQDAWGTSVYATALQTDNRVLVSGSFGSFNGVIRPGIARLNTDGSLDAAFNPSSQFLGGVYPATITVQPDGRILLGGSFTYLNNSAYTYNSIARLTTTGVLDPTFQPGGVFADFSFGSGSTTTTPHGSAVISIKVQTDGRIVVGTSFWNMTDSGSTTLRLNADGSVDSTFQSKTGSDAVNSHASAIDLALQPDGHVVVAGSFSTFDGAASAGLARLNSNGSVDSNFTANGSFNGAVNALTLQTDGRPVVGGNFTQFGSTARTSLAGLNITGGLDTGFTVADSVIDPVYKLSRGDDNRLLLAGPTAANGGTLKAGFVLLRPDAEPTFTLQPQGGIFNGGVTVTLTAKATGYPDVSYQWMKDGSALAGQNGSSLVLTNVTVFTAGTYTIVATNTHGSTTSAQAIVGVAEHVTANPNNTANKKDGAGAVSPWMLVALAGATALRFRRRSQA